MKLNKLFFVISTLVFFSVYSCKKAELNEPVSSDCSLAFADSSANNPKNSTYQAVLDKYVKKGLPGLVVLIRTPNEGLWIGASGYARIEDNTPMKKCNIVYSGSIAKTYTAVAIMFLYEEGKIKLDDKINQYLSKDICDNIPNGNKATIRQLLSHTSGIPNLDSDPGFVSKILNEPFSITRQNVLKIMYGEKPLFKPGEGYEYSSTGFELLTHIIDEVTGEPHGSYFTSHIFMPLGVQNTYKSEEDLPKPEGLINAYFDRLGDGKIENVSDINYHLTEILSGASGIMASIYDYYVFNEALFKGNLLAKETLDQMTVWHDTYTSKPKNKYGLGLYRIETKYGYKVGHDGDGIGEGTDMFYFPEYDITIVTATNLGTFLDTDLSRKYNNDFQDELLDVVFK